MSSPANEEVVTKPTTSNLKEDSNGGSASTNDNDNDNGNDYTEDDVGALGATCPSPTDDGVEIGPTSRSRSRTSSRSSSRKQKDSVTKSTKKVENRAIPPTKRKISKHVRVPIQEFHIGYTIRRLFNDGNRYNARVMTPPQYVFDEEKDRMVLCRKVKYYADEQEEWFDEDQLNKWAYDTGNTNGMNDDDDDRDDKDDSNDEDYNDNGDDDIDDDDVNDDDDNNKKGDEDQRHSPSDESHTIENKDAEKAGNDKEYNDIGDDDVDEDDNVNDDDTNKKGDEDQRHSPTDESRTIENKDAKKTDDGDIVSFPEISFLDGNDDEFNDDGNNHNVDDVNDDDDNNKKGDEDQRRSPSGESHIMENKDAEKTDDGGSVSFPDFPGFDVDADADKIDTSIAATFAPKRRKPTPKYYYMRQRTSKAAVTSIISDESIESAHRNKKNKNRRESKSSTASTTCSDITEENDGRRRSKRTKRPMDTFLSAAAAELSSPSSSRKKPAPTPILRGRGRPKRAAANLGVTKKTREEARNLLIYKMGITEEEVDYALNQLSPPYSQNKAISLIHKRRLELRSSSDDDCEEEMVKFNVEIGMRVRVREGGSNWHGTITEGPSKMIPEGESKPVKFWGVTFDDGTKEDFDWHELLRYRASRPIIKFDDCRGRTLNALELFAGEGIVTQEFSELKWSVKSIDVCPKSYATDILDIMEAKYKDIGFVPDFIWASPPCTTCSNLAGGYHRDCKTGAFEKTQEAREHNQLMAQMMYIMKWAKKKNPHLIVVIENPQGQMQKLPMMIEFMKSFGLNKSIVDYCAFERPDKKPTNLWTNDFNLHARLSNDFRCTKGKCPYHGKLHPIGVRSHKQFNAAAIPQKLAEEVAEYVHAKFLLDRVARLPRASLSTAEEEEFDLHLHA
uniref:DNA (cytosine-5-)-methyltransferase n=1 Tax=Pseudo-nitzschia australis TaxID=44445 RepID=A0A7S4EG38_9STRA